MRRADRSIYSIALFAAATAACVHTTPVRATTATNLASFEGREEPTVLYHPSTMTFTDDSYVNMTDQGGGVIRTTLRYQPDQDWWDGDRDTTNDDRQRAEVKGLGAHQKTDQTFRYTFDFRTDPDMVGTSSFFHIFQLKSTDGESGSPAVTVSLYSNHVGRLKLWSGPDDNATSTTVRTFTWNPNTWIHADVLITTATGNTGSLLGSFNGDAFTGSTATPLYRPSATDYRPKWGFYRAIDSDMYVGTNWMEHRNVTAGQVAANDLIWNPTPTTDLAWNTTDTNNWIKSGLPGAFTNGNNVIFSDTGVGNVVVGAGGVTPGTINVANTTGNLAFSGGAVGGSGALTKTGAGTLTIGNAWNSTGAVNVSGGTLVVNGSVAGLVTANSGTTVTGVGAFPGGFNLLGSSRFAPGNSMAILTMKGFGMSGVSTLDMLLGGTTPGLQYNQIVATGPVAPAGTLAVTLVNGFTPSAGQVFDLITASTIQGSFSNLQLPTLAGGLTWQVQYKPTSVSLAVLPSGDFNRDRVVDAADLTRWSGAFGSSSLGDGDGDADSDGADFLTWQQQLGNHSAVAAVASVPEPASVMLLALATATAARGGRRRIVSVFMGARTGGHWQRMGRTRENSGIL